MALFKDLSTSDFEEAIRKYAEENEWVVNEIDGKHAILEFEGDSGRTQTVFMVKYKNALEFSVPSEIGFEDEDEIPGEAAVELLKRNAELKRGFWCMEKIGKYWMFSVMHNEPLEELDSDVFGEVVDALVSECEEFDEMWEDADGEEED